MFTSIQNQYALQVQTLQVNVQRLQADTCTPVSAFLKLRDRYSGVILLEGNESSSDGSYCSYLGLDRLAEIVVEDKMYTVRSGNAVQSYASEKDGPQLIDLLDTFRRSFHLRGNLDLIPKGAVGVFGYLNYDAVNYFEPLHITVDGSIPLARYAVYRYVLVFDHRNHALTLVELIPEGNDATANQIEILLRAQDVPRYRFGIVGDEENDMTDAEFLDCVDHAKAHCQRGDTFQLVLSRRFRQSFTGDEFNVYRALRSINPSPYLFYVDYGSYRIFGSSPEAQLRISNDRVVVNPIAGTCARTGDPRKDKELAEVLLNDPKEAAEHVMLVDLARNDLSRVTRDVGVDIYRSVQQFSHVQHLVSEVSGRADEQANPYAILAATFPAGTLSGAPKFKAMQLISKYEASPRGWYGGCIGQIGFDGTCRQAILIRSFLSHEQKLTYRAGAGIVNASQPESERIEIVRKLQALRQALLEATTYNN